MKVQGILMQISLNFSLIFLGFQCSELLPLLL